MALSDALFDGRSAETGFIMVKVYLDNLVRHLGETSILPGFK